MMPIFETHNFSVLDVENLWLHYAKTLEHWLARFDRNVGKIEEMYDHYFVRAWRLYSPDPSPPSTWARYNSFQVVFARGTDNKLPWSREHLYQKLPLLLPVAYCVRSRHLCGSRAAGITANTETAPRSYTKKT